MKYILNNPTEEQINSLKKLGLCVYRTSEGIHYVDVPEIKEDDLPEGVVDLGLSVKWASCNIGASKSCESGLLFQFGRVDGYAYGDANNKFRTYEQNIADTGDDYTPVTTSGTIYNTGEVLGTADDAAYVVTNGKLRMPTSAEIDELVSETTNQWCQCTVLGDDHTSHTVYGRLFTGSNGNKIFIPAAGYFDGYDSFGEAGSMGFVWSSSVHTAYADDAVDFYGGYYICLDPNHCDRGIIYRCGGFSVRGVCK